MEYYLKAAYVYAYSVFFGLAGYIFFGYMDYFYSHEYYNFGQLITLVLIGLPAACGMLAQLIYSD